MRDFNAWLSTFRASIADYGYYVDFPKIYKNVEKIKVELNILNSLIGSKNIEKDFENVIKKYTVSRKISGNIKVHSFIACSKNE